MTGFLFVGLGGAVGAMLRYAISLMPYRGTFPMLTLITNVMGAVLIGFVAGVAVKHELPDNVVKFLKTGICGGFTTFSTFSLETYNLCDSGKYILAGVYALLSVILCFAGIVLGMYLSERTR